MMVQQREQAAFVTVFGEVLSVVEELAVIVAAAAVYYYMVLVTVSKEQSIEVHLCTVVGSILAGHLDKEEPGILAWQAGPKMDSFQHTDHTSPTFSATCTTALQLLSP